MTGVAAVLGPGAVGSALAVRLVLARVHTICVARPETVGVIALAGLSVESQRGLLQARPEVVEELTKPVDLLLVTVKAPALEEALQRIDPAAVEHGVTVPLLNGLEHMDVVRARLGSRVAAGTISHFQAYRVGRVQVIEATPPPLVTIASNGGVTRGELEDAATLLRQAGVDVHVGQNEKRVLWHKAARISALAAATAVTGRSVGDLRQDPIWRARLQAAIAEACQVAEADGVSLQAAGQWKIVEDMPLDLTPSAARDVSAGRRSELDAILGSVLRAAERLGVPCPTLGELAVAAGLR
ncbi:MAG TPA: 2-dehydropantoate 2-reductase [Gaiellaceae bacterium]|nr:2-dehydropantoate 2-reductase [Gaiellaceae bacterium]